MAVAGEHKYFYEDEVFRITKKGNVQFGMVLENSELVSGDENSDEEEGGRMKKGHIRVSWHPTGVEEVIPEVKVQLADRSLMPGDVVRRLIKGKDTQRGYCRHIRVSACVQVVGTKQVITNVQSSNLVPLEEFGVDIAACLDSWVGGIKTVHSKLTLQCNDGSRCIINDVDACGFENFTDKRDMDFEFPGHRDDFYPGQTLWGPVHVLEDAEWINCTKEMKANCSKPNKTVKVVVEDVKTDNVGIHWQCRAYSKDGASADKEQPKYLVQGDDLKRLRLLNVFEPCTLQVGDRNFYTVRDGDKITTKEQWRLTQKEKVLSTAAATQFSKRSVKRNKLLSSVAALDNGAEKPISDFPVSTKVEHAVGAVSLPVIDLHPPPVDIDEWDTEDTGSISDTASISSGASSTTSHGSKKKQRPALMTKVLKKKKLRRAKKRTPNVALDPGARIVVETLSTTSIADVVWQDGSVEENILSTQLYPIHHLDDQEFFPGDFVIENKDESSMRVYGVVQSVDHLGRTATVKWFKTYTSLEEPRPSLLEETEVSVYDMKDHPDFQYRPGTVVIRVANFEGEDAHCTAGQVMDNYPKGMVLVSWVDGHVSMSWPQDLYKVGEYDSDEGELWDDGSSDVSWVTQSEDCCIAEDDMLPEEDDEMREKLKPKLGANIEKARIAMSRLEEIFMQNPALQTTAVMRQLLDVYKDCRYLDKLMGTSFFHESHFQGLLERVRERGRANAAQRVADQVSRLFYQPDGMELDNDPNNPNVDELETGDRTIDRSSDCDLCPKCENEEEIIVSDLGGNTASNSIPNGMFLNVNVALLERKLQTAANNNKNIGNDTDFFEFNKDKDVKAKIDSAIKTTKSQPDAMKTSVKHSATKQLPVTESPMTLDTSHSSLALVSGGNTHVCAKLCSLIKAQLVMAHGEVTRRFGGGQAHMTLSGAVNSGSGSSQKSETEESIAEASGGVMTFMKDGLESLLHRLSGVPSDDKETDKETDKPKKETDYDKKVEEVVAAKEVKEVEKVVEQTSKKEEEEVVAAVEMDAPNENEEGFSIADCAPNSHKFKLTMFQPTDPSNFFKAVRKELRLLRTSLPPGIWVKGFEDRMDLYSVMIRGPEKTPYEDGLFFFDFQLSVDYPKAPPLCHYVSYCSDRLNPNLYEDGKVCVSLLGTWSGKGTEVWSQHSNLLQVIISIQGLILVSEPYFNEAGYEKQKGSQSGNENSRMYNEMAVLKLVQALSKMITHPPPIFQKEINKHFEKNAHKFLTRLDTWLDISEDYNKTHPVTPTTPGTFRENHGQGISDEVELPEFPLIPASKGFCLTLRKTIATFRDVLASVDVYKQSAVTS